MSRAITYLKEKYVFIIPTVISALLIAIDIGSRSLWLDEGASISIASQSGHALAAALARDGGNMLLYYLFLHVIIKFFGDGVIAMRLPALVGGVLSTLGITVICAKLFNNLIAFASGILSSVSLPFIYWSQNARSYTLIEATVIWSYYFMILVIEHSGEKKKSFWYLFGYAACTLLGAYMSFIALLAVIPQLLILAQFKKPIKRFIGALAIDAFLCIPLAVLAIQRGKGQLFWIPKPSLQLTTPILQFMSSAGVDNNFILNAVANDLVIQTCLLIVLTLVLGIAIFFRQRYDTQDDGKPGTKQAQARTVIYKSPHFNIGIEKKFTFGIYLMLWWLIAPFLCILLESWLGQSIYNPKYFLPFIAPLSVLICVILLSDIFSHNIARYICYAIFIVVLGLRLASLIPTYGVSPENWQQPTAYVLHYARQGDCVAFYPADTRTLVVYYMKQSGTAGINAEHTLKPILPTVPLNLMPSYVEDYYTLTAKQISAVSGSCKRIWLVSSHQGIPNGTRVSYIHYSRFVRLYNNLARKYPGDSNAVFGWSAPVDVTLFQQ